MNFTKEEYLKKIAVSIDDLKEDFPILKNFGKFLNLKHSNKKISIQFEIPSSLKMKKSDLVGSLSKLITSNIEDSSFLKSTGSLENPVVFSGICELEGDVDEIRVYNRVADFIRKNMKCEPIDLRLAVEIL